MESVVCFGNTKAVLWWAAEYFIFVLFLKLIHHLDCTWLKMKWRFYFKNKRPLSGLTDADFNLQINENTSNSGASDV